MAQQITTTTYTNIQRDITNLQNYLKELTTKRDTDTTLTDAERNELTLKIVELTRLLQNSQQRLIGLGTVFSNVYDQSTFVLSDQEKAQTIVNNELENSGKNLDVLQDTTNNKIRQVEINNYFAQKYEEQSQLMKIIIFTFIPIIILSIINKKMGLLLPDNIYYILVAIVFLMGVFFFLKRLKNMLSRDNMNYQELHWVFDPSKAPPSNGKAAMDPWASLSGNTVGTCLGSACCTEGEQIYNAEEDKCVNIDKIEADTTVTTDGFTMFRTFKKPDVTLEIDGGVQPYTSSAIMDSLV
jgi:hypothetical protein